MRQFATLEGIFGRITFAIGAEGNELADNCSLRPILFSELSIDDGSRVARRLGNAWRSGREVSSARWIDFFSPRGLTRY